MTSALTRLRNVSLLVALLAIDIPLTLALYVVAGELTMSQSSAVAAGAIAYLILGIGLPAGVWFEMKALDASAARRAALASSLALDVGALPFAIVALSM